MHKLYQLVLFWAFYFPDFQITYLNFWSNCFNSYHIFSLASNSNNFLLRSLFIRKRACISPRISIKLPINCTQWLITIIFFKLNLTTPDHNGPLFDLPLKLTADLQMFLLQNKPIIIKPINFHTIILSQNPIIFVSKPKIDNLSIASPTHKLMILPCQIPLKNNSLLTSWH